MAFRDFGNFNPYKRKPWQLMSSEFSNTNMPPIHSGPEREYQGYNRWNELLNQGSAEPFFQYGKIPDSATMMPKSSTYGKKKGSNKLKYIVEALQEMEGETPDALAGRDRVGGTRPGMPGYTPTNMGAYMSDPLAMQAALAEARRKKEKEGLMNLLPGSYA